MSEYGDLISLATSAYIDHIEEILPNIIAGFKLDDSSIKHDEARHKSRMSRTKEKRRHVDEKLAYRRDLFSMMRSAKAIVQGYTIEHSSLAGQSVITEYNDTTHSLRDVNIKDISEENGKKLSNLSMIQDFPISLDIETEFFSPFISIVKPDLKMPSQSYSSLFLKDSIIKPKICSELKKEMKKNMLLKHVIDSIIDDLDQIIEDDSLQLTYNIDERPDIEYPEWKKIIIHFDFDESDFNLKMKIWDDLDDFIRKKISNLKNIYYKHGSKSKNIDQINQIIYTDINF